MTVESLVETSIYAFCHVLIRLLVLYIYILLNYLFICKGAYVNTCVAARENW